MSARLDGQTVGPKSVTRRKISQSRMSVSRTLYAAFNGLDVCVTAGVVGDLKIPAIVTGISIYLSLCGWTGKRTGVLSPSQTGDRISRSGIEFRSWDPRQRFL